MGRRFKECRYCVDERLSNNYGHCKYCRKTITTVGRPDRFRNACEAFEYTKEKEPKMVPVMFNEFALKGTPSSFYKNLDIGNVIFNPPATIVFWTDGTKTVVKAVDEEFDAEKGLAMAISKKLFGNKYDYYEKFRKWVGRYEKKAKRREEGVYLSAEFDTKLMEDLLEKMPTTMSLVEVDAESLKGKKVR